MKDEDVEMQEPEPEPEPEPPKKKRGRPPKNATAKLASQTKGKKAQEEEIVVEESDVEPPPPLKKAHGRTRSKANLESETETAPPTSRSTLTRTKSGSRAKVKQEEVEEPVVVSAASKKTSKQVPPTAEEDDVPSAPPKKPKGKAVSRSKPKTEKRDSDVDDGAVEPERQEKSHIRAESGRSAASRGLKVEDERKSSLSEDAGYATAEPPPDADRMDVDDEPGSPPKPPVEPPAKKAAPMSHRAELPARAPSRSSPADSETGKRPSPVANGVRSSSVASSSRLPSSRPPSKLNKDSLKVIEIDSEGEESGVHDPPAKARSKGKAPVSRQESTNVVLPVKKPSSQASKKKMQVEVLLPPPPSRPKAASTDDMRMEVDSPQSPVRAQPVQGAEAKGFPAQPDPPGPSTPISAVHRSISPSPVRAASDGTHDVHMPDPDEELLAAAPNSPRAYHPYLAQFPVEKLGSLTEEEAEMTLEQYIRREMESQYAQLKADAERRIEEFKEKAAETRKLIETS